MIRQATITDASAIAEIYNHYILNSTITFEEEKVDQQIMEGRINLSGNLLWWVFEEEEQIVAYAHPSQWKPRSAYRYTVESSVYVKPRHQRRGIGLQLYKHLIKTLKGEGFHSVLAGITLPNAQSVSFHEKMGFKKVGQLEEVGFKFKRWIDVGYWELKL